MKPKLNCMYYLKTRLILQKASNIAQNIDVFKICNFIWNSFRYFETVMKYKQKYILSLSCVSSICVYYD
jgi:hypothetical protein